MSFLSKYYCNPYPSTIFCPENVVYFLHLLYIFNSKWPWLLSVLRYIGSIVVDSNANEFVTRRLIG